MVNLHSLNKHLEIKIRANVDLYVDDSRKKPQGTLPFDSYQHLKSIKQFRVVHGRIATGCRYLLNPNI